MSLFSRNKEPKAGTVSKGQPATPAAGRSASPMRSTEDLEARMAKADWRMRWEILPGVMTPGVSTYDPVDIVSDFGLAADLTGADAIDVGAWDGAISFELEKRGAKVLSSDIQNPDATAFNVAKEILDSKNEYLQASVYDLPDLLNGRKFDIVMFRAVYYHLKNPIGAFEALAKITKPGGVICVEGECLRYYAEDLEGNIIDPEKVRVLAESDIPLTLCYPGSYKRGENWFIPNVACFKGWMQAAGFVMSRSRIWEDSSLNGQRLIATCTRTDADLSTEHTVLEPGWRKSFDQVTSVVSGQAVHDRDAS